MTTTTYAPGLAKIVLVAGLLATAGPALAQPASAQSAEDKAARACQAQALGSIAKTWPGVLRGQFEIIVSDGRCLLFLRAPSFTFKGKRAAWLIEGKTGDLLAEFYGPISGDENVWKGDDRGLCSYRGGKFPTSECSWSEYLDKVSQMW
jgi:hypothetical protein